MKRLYFKIFILAIITSGLSQSGCETDRVVFRGPSFVRFTEDADFARESVKDIIEIPLNVAATSREQDIVVSFSVGGSAREGVDYTIENESRNITIPAGEYLGSIKLQLINNANNVLRSQDIIFTITGVNSNEVTIGQGPSGIGKQFTFTIFDDCLLSGSYRGVAGGSGAQENGIIVNSEDCDTYFLSNWDIGFDNSIFDYALTFIDQGDNTLVIPQQESPDLPSDFATIQGSGFWDPVTGNITLTVQLVDLDDEHTFTLIPE